MRDGIRVKVSSWQRIGPNVIPHAAKATGVYLNSMLAVERGEPRRLRRGDPAHERRLRRRRLGREHLRRQATASSTRRTSRDLDPAGITRDSVDPDRAGPRPPRRREAADPHRPVPRGRDLHVRHGCRGDADAGGRRPARGPPGPVTREIQAGVPRHGARAQRALGAVARARAGRRRRRTEAGVRQEVAAGPALGAVPRRARGGARARGAALGAALARPDDRPVRGARRRAGRRALRRGRLVGHRRAAPALRRRGDRARRRGDHVAVLLRRERELLHLRGRRPGLRRHRPADAEPRPGRGRGGDHAADEGDRRGGHLRLSVRAGRAARDRRAARARADPGLLRGARRRVPRARRSARTARPASSRSIRTSRSRPARAESSRRTPRRSGGCSARSATRAAATRAAGSSMSGSASTTACRDVAAALGVGQVERLDEILALRSAVARRYDELLRGIDGIELPCPDDETHMPAPGSSTSCCSPTTRRASA